MWWSVGAALGVAAVGACARMGAPPGGPEDRRPPVVVRTEPDTLAAVEGFRGPVRFHFDERISERVSGGTLDEAVIVSPRTGDVRVSHGRQGISVEIDGGFRPGQVYRVTLLPVVSDLFGNQLRDPFEVVFSTGAEVSRAALAGLAFDRVTGRGVANAEVFALSEADSTVYVARTDTGGVYAMRYLPAGRYRLTAFEDRNRNRIVDRMEPQGTRSALIPGQDTLLVDLPVLQPDTLPARVTRASVLDSVTIAVEFDDYLDPDVPSAQAAASLARDSTAPEGSAPEVEQVLHEYEYTLWIEAIEDSLAREDSVRAAEAARVAALFPDTTEVADSVPPEEPPPLAIVPPALPALQGAPRRAPTRASGEPEGPPRAPDGALLPARRMVLRLSGFLEANVPYRLSVSGVTNIALVPFGGGEVLVVREPPPVADSLTAPDSIAVDTAGAPPDTGNVALGRLDLWRR